MASSAQRLVRELRGKGFRPLAPSASGRFQLGYGSSLTFRAGFGYGIGRELSAIRNVARTTATGTLHRGHDGFIVLPVTPSK